MISVWTRYDVGEVSEPCVGDYMECRPVKGGGAKGRKAARKARPGRAAKGRKGAKAARKR